MDPRQQQATFIPKRPITSISSERRTMGFFSLITLVIFICTGIAAGGVYFWKVTLEKQLIAGAEQLAEEESNFGKQFIIDMVAMNSRIETSRQLLNKHVAVTALLEALGNNTLQSVQFNDFSFNVNQVGGAPVVRVSLKGVARDYTALAAQSAEIAKVNAFKDPIFSEFTLTQEGRVSFALAMNIDPKLIEYRLKNQVKAAPTLGSATSTATSTRSSATSTINTIRP